MRSISAKGNDLRRANPENGETKFMTRPKERSSESVENDKAGERANMKE